LTLAGGHGTVGRIPPGFKGRAMLSRLRLIVVSAILLAGLFVGGSAGAANFFEKNFGLFGPRYDGIATPCEAALDAVAQGFSDKEATFWNSSLQITGFTNVHEIAYRPWQPNTIPRRFCTATAMISDGKPRTVNYSIIEDGGFASFSDGLEFCVVGLDRNWAYNPTCRMARP
jgi:hypothetical protein